MKIKLKGELDFDLRAIELKEGDVVHATPDTVGTTGAMYFVRMYRGWRYDCVVWPQNYTIVEPH